jgi:signal transduction histidine kinase
MTARLRQKLPWIAAWLVLAVTGAVWLARAELANLREGFDVDARIMHRLLSQRASQHDAVLATLGLLQSKSTDAERERRLSSVYPQVISVEKHAPGTPWSSNANELDAAEKASRAASRPALGPVDFQLGRYWIMLASTPNSYALQIDARAMVPWREWPVGNVANEGRDSAVRVTLEHAGQSLTLQPGQIFDARWRFDFRKRLATDSQPFDVGVARCVSWAELPWLSMIAWVLGTAALLAALATLMHQRRERARAQELLRLGQVARLNTLGELAAGMAHELNQPLTAVLANTQAAMRLLKESPPEIETAQTAMQRASEQARRASDVLTRLRRTVERTDTQAERVRVRLYDAVRDALYLLEPQCRERRVTTEIVSQHDVEVLADPVALEQITHNLVTNALHALDQIDANERSLTITLSQTETHGELRIADNGPGIALDALPRLFEPFFSTRSDSGGLGLGLSVCESLVTQMDGHISAQNRSPRGAEFIVTLPLATAFVPVEP